MKKTCLLALALCASATLLTSGCATQPTKSGKNTYFLGGLVTLKTNDYQEPSPLTNHVDWTKFWGNGNPSGTSVSYFYEAVKFTNY
jgi:hypothetical protein